MLHVAGNNNKFINTISVM